MLKHLDVKDLECCEWSKDFPIITSGAGSGKTSIVMSRDLANHIEQETDKSIGFILLLVPTESLRDNVLKNKEYKSTKLLTSDLLQPIDDEEIIRVACFAQLANYLLDDNTIMNKPDLIVIDEIDLLISWSLQFQGYINVWNWILSNKKDMFTCGLTATPSLLLDYVNKDTSINFVDLTPDYSVTYKANTIEVISHSSASTYLKTIETSKECKALVYVRSARLCKSLYEQYKDKAGYVISKHSEHYEAQEVESSEFSAFGKEKIPLREYIIKHEKLPPHIEILFFNDSMGAGCNIKDSAVKIVIADTVDLAIGIQAKGRIRHDLEKFVFVYNNKEKAPYFKDLERAREFFNEAIDLKTWYIQEKEINGADILTYKYGNGYKINPFAKAIYEYIFDIYSNINDKKYFEPLVAHSNNDLVFIDGKELASKARNLSNFSKIDISDLFGFEDDESKKIITAKDLQVIAKQADIRDKKSNVLGKESFCKYINENTDYSITNIGVKKEFRRKVCYEIKRTKNVG